MSHDRSLRWLAHARDGTMALEFALIAPPLLLLAVAAIDFGSAVNRQMQLVSAVRAGADLAIARPPTGETLHEIRAAVELSAPMQSSNTQALTVEMFCERADGARVGCNLVGDQGEATYVAIRVSESWAPTLSYPLLRQAVPLAASQTVRVR